MPGPKPTQLIKFVRSSFPPVLVLWGALTALVPSPAQSSGTWARTGSLHFPRIGHTATLLTNGQVLIARRRRLAKPSSSGRRIEPGPWNMDRYRQSRNSAHRSHGDVAGEWIRPCSRRGQLRLYRHRQLYNPSTGQWSTTGSLSVPRAFPGAALLRNGQVLMAGGGDLRGNVKHDRRTLHPRHGQMDRHYRHAKRSLIASDAVHQRQSTGYR